MDTHKGCVCVFDVSQLCLSLRVRLSICDGLICAREFAHISVSVCLFVLRVSVCTCLCKCVHVRA